MNVGFSAAQLDTTQLPDLSLSKETPVHHLATHPWLNGP